MISDSKRRLRAAMRKRLDAFHDGERQSRGICRVVENSGPWAEARVVVGYVPAVGEPDIMPLLELGIRQGKTVGLLRTENDSLVPDARIWDGSASSIEAHTRFKIRQIVKEAPLIEMGEGTLLLVPGLSFALTGIRLGRGGAYYDRFLAAWPACRPMGLCFSFQIVKELPAEPHDVRMRWIADESDLLTIRLN